MKHYSRGPFLLKGITPAVELLNLNRIYYDKCSALRTVGVQGEKVISPDESEITFLFYYTRTIRHPPKSPHSLKGSLVKIHIGVQ